MRSVVEGRPLEKASAASGPLVLRAARREWVEHTPVWFMRQAGRSLPEYRKVRERHDLLSICRNSELCVEVSHQPVRRLGVDAAIIFADIMLPVICSLGTPVRLVENVGPVVDEPVRSRTQIERMQATPAAEAMPFVMETIRSLRRTLARDQAVIGFSGAPFTLAGYLIEGKPTREFLRTKAMMYSEPDLWDALMQRLSLMVLDYLRAQVGAGVDLVQVFDSWVGCLSPADYRRYVLPHMQRIFQGLKGTAIAIHFGTGTAALLQSMRDAGGDVIGLDWRVELGQAWKEIGFDRGVQGNLDPAVLLGPWPEIESRARAILESAGGRPGHIFNLGHGVLPDTPVENLQRLVELVHAR